MGLYDWLTDKMTKWLIHEDQVDGLPLCDYDRLSFEIRPCDVLLVEGRSRVSNVIKNITMSPWTHAALYIGRIHEIDNEEERELVKQHYKGDPGEQLLIEALLGAGTIVVPLRKYQKDHLRICRPKGLSRQDSVKVVTHALQHVGGDYNVRQLLDLARFLLPYGVLPRKWGSTLFDRKNIGEPTKTVCSSMIASAFNSVHFPILPVVHQEQDGSFKMYKRNTRLYTPPDFDYSPYFEIIKYAMMGFDDLAVYRNLPWDQNGVICNDENDCYIPQAHPAFSHAVAESKKNIPEAIKAIPSDTTESRVHDDPPVVDSSLEQHEQAEDENTELPNAVGNRNNQ